MTAKLSRKPKPGTVLVLRTCRPDLISRNGTFQWPAKGPVSCPDWKPTASCGNGLHGLLWGVGDGGLLDWSPEARWLVVEVPDGSFVELSGKVKFPAGHVLFAGERHDATRLIGEHAPAGSAIVGGTATAGDWGAATAGDRGTATAGYRGTATAGDRGTATAGDWGTATAGDRGTATAGYRGTATAGDRGTATAGDMGTATAGDRGTATAGDEGAATAGDRGTATAGDRGTATAGDRGALVILLWDGTRYRRRCVEVDGTTIKADTAYRLNEAGEFVEASS